MHDLTVDEKSSGLRLLTFIKNNSPLSTKSLRWLIEHNRCRVNGTTERFTSVKVAVGDRITLDDEIPEAKVSILFEDDTLIAIDKPAWIASEELLKEYFLVHRLDRDTTGVLLFAKNRAVKAAMENLFRQRSIEKSYVAIVHGTPREKEKVIDMPMIRLNSKPGETTWGIDKRGVHAETRYFVERSGKHYSKLLVFPKTGRTHQIRVHLAAVGHAVLGDCKYGTRKTRHFRPLLHALSVSFVHPQTKVSLTITSPLPEDIVEALKCL